MSILSAPHFHSEVAAYAYVEARVWPDGPVCPHCGSGKDRIRPMSGKTTRVGLYKCYACRKPMTVKIGTIFEDSHVPMHKWLQAIFLMCASKKGVSSNQLHRTLGVTLKTAWYLSHRIREAMRGDNLRPLGGEARVVEADETFFLNRKNYGRVRGGYAHKHAILSLVERGGSVRSVPLNRVTQKQVTAIVRANIANDTRLMTDTASYYRHADLGTNSHEMVNHGAREWVRGDIHTNTVEGYFSIFKRGMKGVYQHCTEKHLHRYLAEFDFRYNNRAALGVNDEARTSEAIKGVVGKRLTYRGSLAAA